MENIYLSIGIRNSSLEEINSAVESLDLEDFILRGVNESKVRLDIMDVRDEYAYASKFLKDNNLMDDTPFFNDFDIAPYGLKIDFDVTKKFRHMDILEPIVFILGQKLSLILATECLVMFVNNTIPAGLFKNGVLVETFEKHNSNFFKNKTWRPGPKPIKP